jgi:hypothetical protein
MLQKKELIVWPLVKKRFICRGPDNIPQTMMNMNLIPRNFIFQHLVTQLLHIIRC